MNSKLVIMLIVAGLLITGVTVAAAEVDGNQIYEIEVENSKTDYDTYIDAYTGIEEDLNDDDVEDIGVENAVTANQISELQAIEIAESVVEGTVVEMELDEDDGRYVYDLELKTNYGKAEVEIDGLTGNVLKNETKSNN